MKVDICTRTETYHEICKDVKFCCSTMQQMYDWKFIELTNRADSYKGSVYINLKDWNQQYYQYGAPERIPMINTKEINFCPWCGEKIET